MSLTDSTKTKNYSNKTDNNIKVAKKDETVAGHFGKGGVLYKGKGKNYPGISKIIKKNKLKVIPINIGLKKNK